jgi:SAM-dependent methyltransferase
MLGVVERTVSPDDLARLKAEREGADRRYNEALTALDAAVVPVPELPAPPAPGESLLDAVNEHRHLLRTPPDLGTGWRARLGGFVWRLVAPYLERQQAFNLAAAEHLSRRQAVDRERDLALTASVSALRAHLHALLEFQSRLMVYLQQVTPFVDTKDREFTTLARRVHEDNAELIDLLDHRTVALNAMINGVGDELAKRWESMVAREQRYEARVAGLAAAHEELRGVIAVVQQATHTLKRELERLPHERHVPTERPAAPAPSGFDQAQATTIDAYKYVGFEDRFRGSQDDIRSRLSEYLPYFEGASDVLDVGCGRGEFLDLLTERGITCRGLDLNREMVEVCRARGLRVDEGDALGFLQSLPDGSLGGLLAAQVVEHLQPDYLLALIDVAYDKLRPGSRIILETINPACWFAFFASYIRDITHVRPLHPDTLTYFLQASGFQKVTVRYRAPYPEHEKLQVVAGDDAVAQTVNANAEKLNRLLFTYLDYAAIGERL